MEFEKIKEIISNVMSVDPSEITMDTSFDDLGVDSLDLFEIVLSLEDEFDVELQNEQIETIKTVGEAVEAFKAFRGE